VGEHTGEVLAGWLGATPADLARWSASGALG